MTTKGHDMMDGKTVVSLPDFSLRLYETVWSATPPVVVGTYIPPLGCASDLRVNHLLVKPRGERELNLRGLDLSYWEGLLSLCWQDAVGQIGIAEMMMRYAFLTIDHGVVEVGKTLRDPGWHVDGLQGAEVPVKTGIDLQYIWTDALPTEFAIGRFETRGLDLEKHNIFQRLGQQVEAPGWHGSLWSADALKVVRMNTCQVQPSMKRTSV